jgi:hypothetical protein
MSLVDHQQEMHPNAHYCTYYLPYLTADNFILYDSLSQIGPPPPTNTLKYASSKGLKRINLETSVILIK